MQTKECLKHGSLFSGIGGFDLAAEWIGWENVFHCEWEEFPQKVLKYYWPKAISYEDIKQTDFTVHRGEIDILTGGFPCQPYSSAGKRKGKEDDRHLWPEMLRAIREIKPTYVVGENVSGLLSWNGGLVFEEVQADLEAEGYEVQPILLPAAGVGAPHKRERVWFVAHLASERLERPTRSRLQRNGKRPSDFGNESTITDTNSAGVPRFTTNLGTREAIGQGWQGFEEACNFGCTADWQVFPTQSPICGGDDGLPRQLDSITFSKWRNESIKAYGNAIVPQVAFQIFKAIHETL